MNPNMPRGVPQHIEGEIEWRFDPGRWKRKIQAEDMKNAKAFLRKGPLSAEDIEHFDTWKQDLIRATEAVMLIERKHWATVNRFIATRLDKDVYPTVASFFPDDKEGFKALD